MTPPQESFCRVVALRGFEVEGRKKGGPTDGRGRRPDGQTDGRTDEGMSQTNETGPFKSGRTRTGHGYAENKLAG